MILISKEEATMLRNNNRGFDVHMSSKTHKARAKRYYATESPKTMSLIEEYRRSIVRV